ncbi:uncharacterized protein LOC129915713 [Episyrphus balteatus]|uniref:uncharacterized protein LOC129915713 n=1 Tax=Episyrphus balteatus TaxID=286459 RepID=UPI0024863B87|nr:uncharacterized protein LOC129915713 [Episyrphus balteatus]
MSIIKLFILVVCVLGCTNSQFGFSKMVPIPTRPPGRVPFAQAPVPVPDPTQFSISESAPIPLLPPELDLLNFPAAIPELPILIMSMEPVDTFVKQLLDIMTKTILFLEYNGVPTRESYRKNYTSEDGSYHEEVGILTNPDTPKQELVVMGADSYNDGETETTTMYTTDKNGYKPRVQTKRRGISPKLRSNMVG